MLYVGAALAILIGFLHSVLGEKYILTRLFQRDNLPYLFGSDWFTKRILRFAWHLTTVAWWGFAAIMFVLEKPSSANRNEILLIIGAVFVISGIISAGFTRGKHISWIIFLAIAASCFYTVI